MPKTLGLYEEEEIQVNNGRFGPYLNIMEFLFQFLKILFLQK